ncbi:MATE family efflux transporter [uncultured Oscillibacter sp.]|uniref:MATE family efflux transporter n=1 Tax=uncultured Oscillibacter sp. TaxID=876091 RepID=UPI0025FB09AB|nr:MATE family efflux transporter [uncultured Oscillibacter sp.]
MERNALERHFTAASLLRFALPNIVMMVFLSLYTIVDGMFISRYVGTLALSAVNMSYPLSSVQLAAGIMLGTGGSAVIARKLGEGKEEEARQDFTWIVLAAAGVGVIFMLLGNGCLPRILKLLGTSTAQFPFCLPYTRILLWFAPAMFLQTAFQVLFVTAGRPGLGLAATAGGGLSNIVLDALFMGPMGWGITGAAVATGIGYCVPAVTGIVYFSLEKHCPLRFTRPVPRWRMLAGACGNGASEMVSNIAVAVTTFLFNILFLRYWGEDGVAAITIVLYFQFVFSAVDLGFSMGVAPVVSYKYGAGDLPQLRQVHRVCMGFILCTSAAMYGLSRLVISACLGLFTELEGPVAAITLEGFPLFAVSFLFMGVNIYASSLFTAFSNGVVSAVISFARTFLFLVGALLLLPSLLGRTGIWLAVPVAELLGLAVSGAFLLWGKRRYRY